MDIKITEREFEKRMHLLVIIYIFITILTPLIIFSLTLDLRVAIISLSGGMFLCIIAFLIHVWEDKYITSIIRGLSDLVDMLMELDEREIFAENEDTILSKLQSRVIKMVRILKKKNQLARQEHENIKGLVSDISHQLKTPISNLKMYSRFLEDEALSSEKRREYVGILCLSVERLNFLSENMIQVSRLESGLIQLDMQEQSLNDTIMVSVKNIYSKAKQKKVEIEYNADAQVVLCHDRNWTAEAVFNLLDNAVKYADSGSRAVLSLRCLGMFVEVAVEDENGAIPEEEMSKVFTRFYRGGNSREKEGIGIGLYLAREIAVRQGGYMKLKTTSRGNVFSILLMEK